MRPEPKEYLAEVVATDTEWIDLRLQLKDGKILRLPLPREMCPEVACVPGGSFFLLTQGVDPEEERELLRKYLGVDENLLSLSITPKAPD